MNSILAHNAGLEDRTGFWARHAGSKPTSGQVVFDVVFGILMPLFCFYADPGIVRGGFSTPIGEVSLFLYAFSGLAIITLAFWLVFGHRVRSATAALVGVLVAGAIISASIGVLILPLTLLGILMVIGLLGLVPFLTAFVYLRNALRGISRAREASRSPRFAAVVLSALFAIAMPLSAQLWANEVIEQSIAEIIDQNSHQSLVAPVSRIRLLRFAVNTDRLVREYDGESNPVRRERIGRAYKGITGDEIEIRRAILND